VWAVLKQLLSTNGLNKSAVKGEVSLVSCRNFWFLSCEDKKGVAWRMFRQVWIVCRQMALKSPFSVYLSSFFFDDKQGISLTTWMVVGETDKWNTNFKFFLPFFFGWLTMLNGDFLKRYFCCFWRKQIIPFVLIVFFFFWAFVFVTKIYICPKDLLLLSIINEMS